MAAGLARHGRQEREATTISARDHTILGPTPAVQRAIEELARARSVLDEIDALVTSVARAAAEVGAPEPSRVSPVMPAGAAIDELRFVARRAETAKAWIDGLESAQRGPRVAQPKRWWHRGPKDGANAMPIAADRRRQTVGRLYAEALALEDAARDDAVSEEARLVDELRETIRANRRHAGWVTVGQVVVEDRSAAVGWSVRPGVVLLHGQPVPDAVARLVGRIQQIAGHNRASVKGYDFVSLAETGIDLVRESIATRPDSDVLVVDATGVDQYIEDLQQLADVVIELPKTQSSLGPVLADREAPSGASRRNVSTGAISPGSS